MYVFALLVGTLLAGLLPLTGSGWQQGLIVAAPLATVFCVYALLWVSFRGAASVLAIFMMSVVFIGLPFLIALALSLVPALEGAAGMMTMAGIVISAGVAYTITGFSRGNLSTFRLGLTITGGFVTAGLILAADAAIKALA